MLVLRTKNQFDICRIGQLLVNYGIIAEITPQAITIDGNISEDLLIKLFQVTSVDYIHNLISDSPKIEEYNQKSEPTSEPASPSSKKFSPIVQNSRQYSLRYPKVKFGEVYLCDFGEPYGHETGYLRPAIVVQSSTYGAYPNVPALVIPCTTNLSKNYENTHIFTFSKKNMDDIISSSRYNFRETKAFCGNITSVDKKRLRLYLGRMSDNFMRDFIQKKLMLSLDIDNQITEYNITYDTLSSSQIEILATVDVKDFLEIAKMKISNENKVQKMLELFKFDLNKMGVQYLKKAILVSATQQHFNLVTLSENVAATEKIAQSEVQRQIIARIKENFNQKKSVALDFIRLINTFLRKQEEI